jgi:E3 ubiquitin-protein ligase HUWE1
MTYFPNSKAKNLYGDDVKDYFKFAGQFLAKALFDKIPINTRINPILLRRIVGRNLLTIDDLKLYDPQIHFSVKFMADDPSVNFEDEEFYFTLMNSDGQEIELIENGKEVRVTQANRKQYARKVAEYHLINEVKDETKAFL